MDPRLLTTLGLVLDIAGAVMLAVELFALRSKTRRETLADELVGLGHAHQDAQRQVEHLREQGFSHSEPQILLSLAEEKVRSLEAQIEAVRERLRTEERRHGGITRRWGLWGVVALVVGFACQLIAAWLPAPCR